MESYIANPLILESQINMMAGECLEPFWNRAAPVLEPVLEKAAPAFNRAVSYVSGVQGQIAQAAAEKVAPQTMELMSRPAVTIPLGTISNLTALSIASLFVMPFLSVTLGSITSTIRSALQTRTNAQILMTLSDDAEERSEVLKKRTETLKQRADQYEQASNGKASWSRKICYLLTAAAPFMMLPQIGLATFGLSVVATFALYLQGSIRARNNSDMAETCRQQAEVFSSIQESAGKIVTLESELGEAKEKQNAAEKTLEEKQEQFESECSELKQTYQKTCDRMLNEYGTSARNHAEAMEEITRKRNKTLEFNKKYKDTIAQLRAEAEQHQQEIARLRKQLETQTKTTTTTKKSSSEGTSVTGQPTKAGDSPAKTTQNTAVPASNGTKPQSTDSESTRKVPPGGVILTSSTLAPNASLKQQPPKTADTAATATTTASTDSKGKAAAQDNAVNSTEEKGKPKQNESTAETSGTTDTSQVLENPAETTKPEGTEPPKKTPNTTDDDDIKARRCSILSVLAYPFRFLVFRTAVKV